MTSYPIDVACVLRASQFPAGASPSRSLGRTAWRSGRSSLPSARCRRNAPRRTLGSAAATSRRRLRSRSSSCTCTGRRWRCPSRLSSRTDRATSLVETSDHGGVLRGAPTEHDFAVPPPVVSASRRPYAPSLRNSDHLSARVAMSRRSPLLGRHGTHLSGP
jgi:hypothetical protein